MEKIKNYLKDGKITVLASKSTKNNMSVLSNVIARLYSNNDVLFLDASNEAEGENGFKKHIKRIEYGDKELSKKYDNLTYYKLEEAMLESYLNASTRYSLVVINSLENVENKSSLVAALKAYASEKNCPVLVSYKNASNKFEADLMNNSISNPEYSFMKDFDYTLNIDLKNGDDSHDGSHFNFYAYSQSTAQNPEQLSYGYNPAYDALFENKSIVSEKKTETVGFENIAGYESIKKELLLIKSWWDNRLEYQAKGITLPTSILLHGPAGTGKSLFAREFTALFEDALVLRIDGEDEEGNPDIKAKFEYARGLDNTVIFLIDEIDYLDRKSIRNLLVELDGLGGINKNIFVLATTNNPYDLPNSLLRRGRMDYIIGLAEPNEEERLNLFKYYFEKCGIKSNIDLEYLAYITKGENAVNISAIVNEARLRYGDSPSLDDFEQMVDKINKRDFDYYGDNDKSDDEIVSCHEIGHVIMANHHKEFFKFYKVSIEKNSLVGGLCKAFPTPDNPGSLERYIADMEVSMGGYVACKLLYGYLDKGATSDIERARHASARLVNTLGYCGFKPLLCHDPRGIPTSPWKKRRNERLSEKILKKAEKRVEKVLKANIDNIKTLSNMLVEKRTLSASDVEKVLSN